MGKRRASVLNMAVTLVWQLCTVVFGLVVPRYFLVGYGADIHGLTSTISNILSYVLLLNAGLLTASVQALYRPLSSKNQTEVNAVLNAVQKILYQSRAGLSRRHPPVVGSAAAVYRGRVDGIGADAGDGDVEYF